MLLFCPSCANTLHITPLPAHQLTPGDARAGTHRFQCRTCPYQMLLTQPFFERKTFENKSVEEVLGGEGSWKNVDRAEGESFPDPFFFLLACFCGLCARRRRRRAKGRVVLTRWYS